MRIGTFSSVHATLALTLTLLFSQLATAQGNNGKPFQELQDQIDSLQQQIDTLLGGTPVSLAVDCDAGDSVVAALTSVSPAIPLTISISGICNEFVFINRDDVTLQGVTPADGVSGIIASLGGGLRINLNNLSIDGSSSPFGAALACFQGSVINANGVTISGGFRGVWAIDGGKCRVINSTIENLFTGVESRRHSLVDLENVVIRNNSTAIDTFLGGSITLQSSSVEQNSEGVVIRNGSTAEIIGSEINNNTGNGLVVSQGSSVFVTRVGSTGISISNNGGDGIQLSGLSTASVFGNPGTITGNGGNDLACLGTTSPVYLANVFGTVDANCP